ncbi:glycosyltransferase [Brachybacterium fresconis]|uniref:Glycosyltransferase involved in cell wall biosynthesis n=1 Tax=Brachybacterium fresconis TaxID=173363 RepID=A0ABS4YM11_9MICO|nr:glycosyltransferase [Brachybacterium fresconis]MBP2409836.1 glycosyltransferase involved in cell wall biosynthesis [Brachybacterium fresconis]
MLSEQPRRIGYVLKMYPRFSETFIVSEILAREAAGEQIVIFSLRPPTDARFHPELARVQAPVIPIGRSSSPRRLWETWREGMTDPQIASGLSESLQEMVAVEADEAEQAITVARLAREHGLTHLHAHFASMATTVARLAGRLADLPYSFTAHAKDIFHRDVEDADLARKLRDAHHAVTISRYNLDHLRERFGDAAVERLHLVRNGLELERFEYLPRPEMHPVPRILAVGRLVEKKGFAHLIDAIAALREEGVHASAEIVGDGPLHEELAERIRERGLEGSVQLTGPRTQEEVRALLQEADLFAAPFVIAEDGNADGLPTVLLEAMASGIPCIAADVTAVGEVVRTGRTGWLIPSGDTAALAAALREVIAAGPERRRLTDAARALIEAEYASDGQAARLRALVEASEHPVAADRPVAPARPLAPALAAAPVPRS